jgi:hypothetical protein
MSYEDRPASPEIEPPYGGPEEGDNIAQVAYILGALLGLLIGGMITYGLLKGAPQ